MIYQHEEEEGEEEEEEEEEEEAISLYGEAQKFSPLVCLLPRRRRRTQRSGKIASHKKSSSAPLTRSSKAGWLARCQKMRGGRGKGNRGKGEECACFVRRFRSVILSSRLFLPSSPPSPFAPWREASSVRGACSHFPLFSSPRAQGKKVRATIYGRIYFCL